MTRRFFIKGDFIEKGRRGLLGLLGPSRPASRSRGGVPQYPVRLPPRPMTSPTQNQAYTSPAKRAATPTCETKEGKEKRTASVRKHPRAGRARALKGRRRVLMGLRTGRGPARGKMRVSSARDRARGEGGGRHETHLGHGKLHAVCPLLLNHLNLTLGALDHGRKPERGWKETGGGCRRGQARSRPDRVASIVAARSGLAVSRARGGSSEGDRARARIVGRGRARGLHALGQVGEHELPPELVHRLGVLHDVLRVLGHGGVVVLHRGGGRGSSPPPSPWWPCPSRAARTETSFKTWWSGARRRRARAESGARESEGFPRGSSRRDRGGSGSPGCRFVDSPSLKNLTLRVERESRRRDGDLARLASRGRRTQRRASHTHPPPHTHTPRSRWLRCSSPPRSSRPPSPATSRCVPQPRERLENRDGSARF